MLHLNSHEKKIKEAIPVAAKVYEKQLREEINKDREGHGKKPFDDDPPNQPPEEKVVTKSTTCLLYTSDAADDLHCVDLGGRRIIK